MSRYIVKFAPAAAQELAEAAHWYAQRSSMASAGFRASVMDAVESVANSPLRWRQVTESDIRRILLHPYPYTVYFEVSGEVVHVLSVAHHRQMARYP